LFHFHDVLIYPSEGEGFGLPLIEAAKQGIPILARDLSVFREVGEGGASYFSATGRKELKIAILIWLKKYSKNTHPKSHDFKISTWNDCSANIKKFLF
jgi:glycosyltransferase involved in cell wall biosynthesis